MKRAFYSLLLLLTFSLNRAEAIPAAEVRFPPAFIEVQNPTYNGALKCYDRCNPFYVKGWYGASFLNDTYKNIDVRYDTGFATGIALGAATWRCNWLLFDFEAEGIYLYNKINRLKVNGLVTGLKGHLYDFAVLGNFIFSTPFKNGFKPYVGIGVGYGKERTHLHVGNIHVKDTDRRVVYQYLAGLSFMILNNPCVTASIIAEGRYLKFDKHIYSAIADAALVLEY